MIRSLLALLLLPLLLQCAAPPAEPRSAAPGREAGEVDALTFRG